MDGVLTAIAELAIAALLIGAVAQWRRGQRMQAVLMAIAALVVAGNIAIWNVPLGN